MAIDPTDGFLVLSVTDTGIGISQDKLGTIFSAFSISRMQLPYVGMAAIAGGNVRVGLEDNIYLSKGVLATNGSLVERAVTILEAMNARVLTPAEARTMLKLQKRH